MPENRIRTYGGDRKGDHCNFPFKVNGQFYGKCVEENLVSFICQLLSMLNVKNLIGFLKTLKKLKNIKAFIK